MLINGLCILFRESKLVTHSFPGVQRLLIKFMPMQEQQGFSPRESSVVQYPVEAALRTDDVTMVTSQWAAASHLESVASVRQHILTHWGRDKIDAISLMTFSSAFSCKTIPIKILLKLVLKGSINNIQTLVYIMAWRRPCDKPLSEPMMVNLPTHIWVTRPQWVNLGVLSQSLVDDLSSWKPAICPRQPWNMCICKVFRDKPAHCCDKNV